MVLPQKHTSEVKMHSFSVKELDQLIENDLKANKKSGGVSKSMLKQSRLNFDKIEKCE